MRSSIPLAPRPTPSLPPDPVSGRSTRGPLTVRSVRTFFIATFAVTWGLGFVWLGFGDQLEAIFGPMGYTNPFFILMVYSPGLVGVFMVWRHYGVRGIGIFARRLILWRMPLTWWVVLVVGIPAVFYTGAVINGTATDFPYSPWYTVLPALVPALFIGPIEELGWRGVALPLLQRRFAPLWAGLIVGAVSALWHTPAFLLSGTKQSSWAIGPFLLGVIAIAVILTAMFNTARGSLLIAGLFHFQINGPAWPDAQPWDMYLFALVAVLVVILNREAMLSRDGAATEVLTPATERFPTAGR